MATNTTDTTQLTREKAYDEHIAPLMAQVFDLCEKHDIAMLAMFALDEMTRCTTATTNRDGTLPPDFAVLRMAIREFSGVTGPTHTLN